jgi:plasmid stabilization system protein ParE
MHEVILTERAGDELQAAHDWWRDHRSANQAIRWHAEFIAAMIDLERDPQRCALAGENDVFPYEIRQLNFGLGNRPTHRAIFTIRNRDIVILRVRHLAQAAITDV